MVKLIATSPLATALTSPVEIGECRIEEVHLGQVTFVAPFDGQEKSVSAALKSTVGVAFPKPGKQTQKDKVRAIWCGPGQALVLGAEVSITGASCVDQSAGWCCIAVSGDAAAEVLARLTPLDLRDTAVPVKATARSLIGHMTASLTRVGKTSWEVMVFRSMSATLVHDLTRAMTHVEARRSL